MINPAYIHFFIEVSFSFCRITAGNRDYGRQSYGSPGSRSIANGAGTDFISQKELRSQESGSTLHVVVGHAESYLPDSALSPSPGVTNRFCNFIAEPRV